jgi:hypothetical protein
MTDKAPRPFDIRIVIGGLFVFYGVVVLIAGIVDGEAAKQKAGGIDINVWTGLGMLLLGTFFLVWMRLNPLPAAAPADDGDAPAEQGPTADH